MARICWKKNGWTTVQEADAAKHVLEISCLTEEGSVVQVRVRHHDGEEVNVKEVLVNGASALPMDTKAFAKAFKNGEIEIKA